MPSPPCCLASLWSIPCSALQPCSVHVLSRMCHVLQQLLGGCAQLSCSWQAQQGVAAQACCCCPSAAAPVPGVASHLHPCFSLAANVCIMELFGDLRARQMQPHGPLFLAADVCIVGAVRTPFGAFQGALRSLTAPQLGGLAIKGVSAKAVRLYQLFCEWASWQCMYGICCCWRLSNFGVGQTGVDTLHCPPVKSLAVRCSCPWLWPSCIICMSVCLALPAFCAIAAPFHDCCS